MKFLFSLLMLFFSIHTYAGMGDCIVYKAKYVLKNGSSVTGFLPIYTDEDYMRSENNYDNDKSFQKLINTVFYKRQHKLTFHIYTKLYSANYEMAMHYENYPRPLNFSFTDSSCIIKLHLDSIKYTIFLDAKLANWDGPSIGLEVLDNQTSLMMQNSSVLNHAFLRYTPNLEYPDSVYDYTFDGYFALNYNKNLSLDDFMNEMDQVSKKIYAPDVKFIKSNDKSSKRFRALQHEKQQVAIPLIKKLRQRGIILVRVYEGC